MTDALGEAREFPEFLNDPVGIVRRRWKPMLAALMAVLCLGVALVLYALTPSYEAAARVLLSSPRISEDFIPSIETGDPFERLSAALGKLLAREQLAEILEAHGLYRKRLRDEPLSSVLGSMRRSISIDLDKTVRQAVRRPTAQIFSISFRYAEPDGAAAVANDLASRFVAENIRMRTEQARVTAEFMRRELADVEAELNAQNALITELKKVARGELPDELQSTLGRLERLQAQRQSVALRVAQTESNLVALEQRSGESATPSPQTRLESLRSELAALRSRYTEDHPDVIVLQEQVQTLEENLASGSAPVEPERPPLLSASQHTLDELKSQLRTIDGEIAMLEQRVERTPERAEQLDELERKAQVLREKYTEFERKVQDADLALRVESAQQGRQIAVVERATPPSSPRSSRSAYLAVVAVASVAVSLGLAFVLEITDPVLTSRAQIEKRLGVQVLGSVPSIG